MGSNDIFSGTIRILEKNMDIRSDRHNLIVTNIANKDTPNYKAFDIAVEKAMKKVVDHSDNIADTTLTRTQSAHLGGEENNDPASVTTHVSASNRFERRGDGNTVDIENEMTKLAENNLMYDAMAQIIRKKFQGLKFVIQGGGK